MKIYTWNLQKDKLTNFVSIIFAILSGLFINRFLLTFDTNIFFLIALPFALIFLVLTVINIKATLILLLFVRALLDPILNLTKLDIFGEDIGVGGIINLFVIILSCFLIFRNPKRLTQNNLFKSWVLFLFVCGITVIYTSAPSRAVRLFLNLTSYMFMAVVPFFIINNMNDKKFWIKILFFSSLLPIAFANIDLFGGGIFHQGYLMRIQGTFTHPNILAFYLVLIIALVFHVLKSGLFLLTRAKRNMLWIYMGNLLVLLLATKTRNAWISCWVLFFVYGLLKERKYILFSILLPFLLSMHPAIMDRIRDLFIGTSIQSGERLNSFAWRWELWKDSLPLIKKKFIFGHGLASFRPLSYSFFTVNLLNRQNVASHNAYLELLFETGIMGLASYIMIFLTILKAFFSKIRKAATNLSTGYALVLSYIISYMIVCFADNLLYYLVFNWYFWFLIGIMLRGIELDDRK